MIIRPSPHSSRLTQMRAAARAAARAWAQCMIRDTSTTFHVPRAGLRHQKQHQTTRPSQIVGGVVTGRRQLSVWVVAGEPSGDAIGARLLTALAAEAEARGDPITSIAGVGGPAMMAAGLEHPLFPMEELSVMGAWELLPHLPRLWRRLQEAAAAVLAAEPDVLITVDSKGFTFRLIDLVRKQQQQQQRRRRRGRDDSGDRRRRALTCVHYVSPSWWAYRGGEARLKGLTALGIDLVLCLLPFEPPALRAAGITAEFVGHPVVEDLAEAEAGRLRAVHSPSPGSSECVDKGVSRRSGSRSRTSDGIDGREAGGDRGAGGGGPVLALLPGSREQELRRHLPLMREMSALLAAGRGPGPGPDAGGRGEGEDECIESGERRDTRKTLCSAASADPAASAASAVSAAAAASAAPLPFERYGVPAGTRVVFLALPQHVRRLTLEASTWPLPATVLPSESPVERAAAFASSTAAVAAAGTATAQLFAHGVPHVVTYRAHPVTELAAFAAAVTPHASLPNIVLGREVVPELLGWMRATPAALAAEAARLLRRPGEDEGGGERGVEVGDVDSGGDRGARQLSAREEFVAALTPKSDQNPPGIMPSVAAARAILDAVLRRCSRSRGGFSS